jgi:4-diphosphocytidyl-2-C-methyl-D-erythritol kinase
MQPVQTCSTPAVYRAWDEMNRESGRGTPAMQSTLMAGQTAHLTTVAQHLHNDLRHAAQHLGVNVASLIEALQNTGALGAEMTGSGSAVFGLFDSEEAARQAARNLRSQEHSGLGYRIWVAPLCRRGVVVDNAAQDSLVGGEIL